MTETEKKQFTETAERLMAEISSKFPESVVHMMRPQLVGSEPELLRLSFAFPAQHWEHNPTGAVHGGIVSTMFDTAMGVTVFAAVGRMTPTMSLNTSFLRPAPGDGTIIVRATVTMRGHSTAYACAEMWEEQTPEKLVATAQAVFHIPQP